MTKIWLVVGLATGLMLSAFLLLWYQSQGDPEASFQRGLTALKSRDIPTLHREIQVLQKFPRYEPQLHLLRGVVFLAGNQLEPALHQFDFCSVHPATRVPALTLAGETFCRLGRHQEAIGVLQQALSLEANTIEAHRVLATAYHETGEDDLAIQELRKVAELDPKDFRPQRLLGAIHKDHHRFAEAVQDFRACLLLKPPTTVTENVLLELSQTLAKLRRYQEALKFLAQAKSTADTEACRAECEFQIGNKGRARAAGLKAIELQPTHLEGLLWLGVLETAEGNHARAAGYLERAAQAHPYNPLVPAQLAGVYERLGRTDKSQEQLRKADEIRKLRERFTELHKTAESRPADAQIRYELGDTARQMHLLRLARMWYRAALTVNPKHAKAKQALSELKIPDKADAEAEKLSLP